MRSFIKGDFANMELAPNAKFDGLGNATVSANGVTSVVTSAPSSARETVSSGDTVLGSIATTDSIALGTSLTGYINTNWEHDWYSITLTAGVVYQFSVGGVGTRLYPGLSFFDASGQSVDQLARRNDLSTSGTAYVDFITTTTGTYYIDVSAANIGEYILTAALNPDNVGAATNSASNIVIGSSRTGLIDYSYDHDWYAVTLTAGVAYQFSTSGFGTSGLYPSLSLLNASGVSIISGQQINFDVTTTGTYYIDVTSYDTGQFTLTAALNPDNVGATTSSASSIDIGTSRTSVINFYGDHDWYAVTLNAGMNYVFGATVADSSQILYFSLRGASGNAISDIVRGELAFAATTTCTYYLDAYAFTSGQYTLSAAVNGDSISADINTTGRIAASTSLVGIVDAATDADWYAITLTAGTTYQFNLNGSGTTSLTSPSIRLSDAAGTIITSNSNQIRFEATNTDIYYLSTGSFWSSTGQYTLSATIDPVNDMIAAGVQTTATIAVGTSLNGMVDTYNDHDWYAVNLTAGANYIFWLTGSGTQPLAYPSFALRNAAGATLATNNINLNPQFNFTPTTSGTYYLDAGNYTVDTGQYTLNTLLDIDQVRGDDRTIASIAIGASVAGSIDRTSDHDWYAVTLTAGSTYFFDLEGDGTLSNPNFTILSATGAAFLNYINIGTQIVFFAPTTGTYYLDVRGDGSQTEVGQFNLSAALLTELRETDFRAQGDVIGDDTTTAGTIMVGSSLLGYIDAMTDSDWYAVTLIAGNHYVFGLEGGGGAGGSIRGPALFLHSATGTLLEEGLLIDNGQYDFNALIFYTPTSSGTYYLNAQSYLSGLYRLYASPTQVLSPGNDTFIGSASFDFVFGDDGNDVLVGRSGSDTLLGGAGNDHISGGTGADYLDGGSGDDILYFYTGDVSVIGGDGYDIAFVDGVGATFRFVLGSDIETVIGSVGSDSLTCEVDNRI
jgi:RTX calcium-binding nonapeptide repeat (4 copies)